MFEIAGLPSPAMSVSAMKPLDLQVGASFVSRLAQLTASSFSRSLLARDAARPIDDGFPAPPDAGKRIDDACVRGWALFFWNGPDEILAFPGLRCGFPKTACIARTAPQYCGRLENAFSLYMAWKLLQRTPAEWNSSQTKGTRAYR